MTEIEEIREIRRRRIRAFKLAIFGGPFFGVLFGVGLGFGTCVESYHFLLIVFMISVCVGVGLSLWAGYFKQLQCPHCLYDLKYQRNDSNLSASRFYCEHCGFCEPPRVHSRVTKPAPPISYYEIGNVEFLKLPRLSSQLTENVSTTLYQKEGKIIGNCIVCHLPITEFEEHLECPFCFSLAHETHLLEWAKIKGYCPHCNSSLKSVLIKEAILVGRIS